MNRTLGFEHKSIKKAKFALIANPKTLTQKLSVDNGRNGNFLARSERKMMHTSIETFVSSFRKDRDEFSLAKK